MRVLKIFSDKLVMGVLYSKNRYCIQIEDKKITFKEFRELKTYKDILQVAGYNVFDTTILMRKGKRTEYFNAGEPFKFGDILYYDGTPVYIAKLY
jgi:hypothetical protein